MPCADWAHLENISAMGPVAPVHRNLTFSYGTIFMKHPTTGNPEKCWEQSNTELLLEIIRPESSAFWDRTHVSYWDRITWQCPTTGPAHTTFKSQLLKIGSIYPKNILKLITHPTGRFTRQWGPSTYLHIWVRGEQQSRMILPLDPVWRQYEVQVCPLSLKWPSTDMP